MPRYPFKCQGCKSEIELVLTVSGYESTKETLVCEACNGHMKRMYVPFSLGPAEIDVYKMDPKEKELHHAHRKYLESRADEIKSGALQIKLNGPKEFHPRNLD